MKLRIFFSIILGFTSIFAHASRTPANADVRLEAALQQIEGQTLNLNQKYGDLNLQIYQFDRSEVGEVLNQLNKLDAYMGEGADVQQGELYLLACPKVVCFNQ
jgi:hypothetical protein